MKRKQEHDTGSSWKKVKPDLSGRLCEKPELAEKNSSKF
jgi:hypothetical protein